MPETALRNRGVDGSGGPQAEQTEARLRELDRVADQIGDDLKHPVSVFAREQIAGRMTFQQYSFSAAIGWKTFNVSCTSAATSTTGD
jgi:hypothetical protein